MTWMPLDSVRAQLIELLLYLGSRPKGQFPDQGGDGDLNALAPGSKIPQTRRFRLIC